MEELHPPADCDLTEFELSTSVWDLILSYCPEKEASEVGRVLGHSLVEQARDLQQEATMLLEIWRQFRQEMHDSISTASAAPRLPEPPALRERIIQEVRFFVEHLRQKSAESGRRVPVLLEENRDVLDYVTGTREGGSSGSGRSRPMSAVSSRDGRETPLRHTPTSDEGSQSSVLSDRVEAVSEQVNTMEVDAVIGHLRQLLEEECAQRRQDIRFLQQCLEEEQSFQRSTLEESRLPPSIQELREFGTRLEQEILQEAQFRPPPSPPMRPVPRPPPLSHNSPYPRYITVNRASKVRRRDPSSANSHTTAAPLPGSNTVHSHTTAASLPGSNTVHSHHSAAPLPGSNTVHSHTTAASLPGSNTVHSHTTAAPLPGSNTVHSHHSAAPLPGSNTVHSHHSAAPLPGSNTVHSHHSAAPLPGSNTVHSHHSAAPLPGSNTVHSHHSAAPLPGSNTVHRTTNVKHGLSPCKPQNTTSSPVAGLSTPDYSQSTAHCSPFAIVSPTTDSLFHSSSYLTQDHPQSTAASAETSHTLDGNPIT